MENNNTKNMKKFRKPLVIVAMVLMVALVCGMGAMTYSKYISSTEQNDVTATAAQWGIVITADASGIFGTDYTLNGTYAQKTTAGNGVAVKANGSAGNIIAPGTTGSMSIEVDGLTEVAAQLTIDLTFDSHIHRNGYYPIQWALTEGAPTESDWKSYDQIADVSMFIPAGTTVDESYIFSWRWKFDNGANNVDDTIIGAHAAGKTTLDAINEVLGPANTIGELGDISHNLQFDLSVTVEQVQEEPTP